VNETAVAPTATRHELRRLETRRRLLEAARALFVKRGYHATRPQDIAREANVGAGTFYTHFSDKADAFRAFTEDAADELMEHVRERTDHGGGFESSFRSALSAILDYASTHPGVISAAFADTAVIDAGLDRGSPGPTVEGRSLRDRFAENLAQRLRDGMARTELHDDYDADLIAHGIVGMVQLAARSGDRMHRDRVVDQLTRFVGRALLRPPEEDSR